MLIVDENRPRRFSSGGPERSSHQHRHARHSDSRRHRPPPMPSSVTNTLRSPSVMSISLNDRPDGGVTTGNRQHHDHSARRPQHQNNSSPISSHGSGGGSESVISHTISNTSSTHHHQQRSPSIQSRASSDRHSSRSLSTISSHHHRRRDIPPPAPARRHHPYKDHRSDYRPLHSPASTVSSALSHRRVQERSSRRDATPSQSQKDREVAAPLTEEERLRQEKMMKQRYLNKMRYLRPHLRETVAHHTLDSSLKDLEEDWKIVSLEQSTDANMNTSKTVVSVFASGVEWLSKNGPFAGKLYLDGWADKVWGDLYQTQEYDYQAAQLTSEMGLERFHPLLQFAINLGFNALTYHTAASQAKKAQELPKPIQGPSYSAEEILEKVKAKKAAKQQAAQLQLQQKQQQQMQVQQIQHQIQRAPTAATTVTTLPVTLVTQDVPSPPHQTAVAPVDVVMAEDEEVQDENEGNEENEIENEDNDDEEEEEDQDDFDELPDV